MKLLIKLETIYGMYVDMRKIYNYLELIRIPGIFTAQADIIAGFLIANGNHNQIINLLLIIISSSFLYSAGMALNDFFDYNIDQKERPKRPLPSGRIKKWEALSLGIIFLIIGVFLSFKVNKIAFNISIILTVLIFLYNAKLKKYPWLGTINMGACRYLNFLFGMSILPLSTNSFFIPLITGIFIFGVSFLAREETKEKNLLFPVLINTICIIIVCGLYGIYYWLDILPQKIGLILCALFSIISIGYLVYSAHKNFPNGLEKNIKILLISLIILDAIIVAGERSFYISSIVLLPLIFTYIISKRFYIT